MFHFSNMLCTTVSAIDTTSSLSVVKHMDSYSSTQNIDDGRDNHVSGEVDGLIFVRQDVDDDKNDHVRVIALGFLVLQPEH
jgi:hypothetical protein